MGPASTGAGKRIAAEKRDERDRRRRVIARRRTGLALLVVLAVAGLIWGVVALVRAPILPVRKVEVVGNSRLTTQSVLASAAVPANATLVRLPVSAIVSRLEANPWVASASVKRVFPGTVQIRVTERTPAALVDAGGTEIWLVSSDGEWLGRRTTEDTASLVSIRDIESVLPTSAAPASSPELMNALAVLEGLSPELKQRVTAISAPSIDKTALILKDDIQVFVGSSDEIGKKSQLALEILRTQKNLVYINVRVTSRPTWRGLDSGN